MTERMRISYILNEVDPLFDSYYQTPCCDVEDIEDSKDADVQLVEDNSVIPSSADLNVLRAMRLIEVVNDFRSIQHNINIHSASSLLDAVTDEEGSLLSRCQEAANQLLQLPMLVKSDGCTEDRCAQLKTCMLDACARRHVAFRIYKTVAAVGHGAMSRRNVAFSPANATTVQHLPSLRGYQDLQSISDAAIHAELRRADNSAGYWTNFDPGLEDILPWARSRFSHVLSNMSQEPGFTIK